MSDFTELRAALAAGPTAGPWVACGPSFGAPLPPITDEQIGNVCRWALRTHDKPADMARAVAQATWSMARTVSAQTTAAPLPAQNRQPLTDEKIDQMFKDAEVSIWFAERERRRALEIYSFGVRDAEAAHGIKAPTGEGDR